MKGGACASISNLERSAVSSMRKGSQETLAYLTKEVRGCSGVENVTTGCWCWVVLSKHASEPPKDSSVVLLARTDGRRADA
jgi:hypothetical protein